MDQPTVPKGGGSCHGLLAGTSNSPHSGFGVENVTDVLAGVAFSFFFAGVACEKER